MLSKIRKQTKGFTIIEALIVLAIAALILLIVFLAVPALQRNSRNTQIRNDASVLLGYVGDYAANNNGGIPQSVCYDTANGNVGMHNATTGCSTTTHKMGNIRAGITVNVDPWVSTQGHPGNPQVLHIRLGSTCGPNTLMGGTSNSRAVAIGYRVETGGGTATACQET